MISAELKEAMKYLSGHAEEVPLRLGGVTASARQFLSLARAFGDLLVERRAEATGILQPLAEALRALGAQAQAGTEALDESMRAAEEAMTATLDAFAAGRTRLDAAVGAADTAIEALGTTAADLAGDVQACRSRCESAAQGLVDALVAGRETLEAALEAATTRAGRLASAVTAGNDAIREPVATATRKLAAVGPDAESHVVDVEARITELMASLASCYAEPTQQLAQFAGEMRAGFEEGANEASAALGKLASEIATDLDVILLPLAESLEPWEAARQRVEEETEALSANLEPLADGVLAVREAAAQNGLAFEG